MLDQIRFINILQRTKWKKDYLHDDEFQDSNIWIFMAFSIVKMITSLIKANRICFEISLTFSYNIWRIEVKPSSFRCD